MRPVSVARQTKPVTRAHQPLATLQPRRNLTDRLLGDNRRKPITFDSAL